MAVEAETFETDVIEASHSGPVLVDFWAEWCGPCRALGPVLEKLAEAARGAWKLVKVDVDAHPEVSRDYGIRGIPAVKLFHQGEVIAEFTGALPEPQVRQWLKDHLPTPGREALKGALSLIAEGRTKEAAAELEAIVAEDPGIVEARAALARLIVFTDPGRAAALVEGIGPGDPGASEADAVRSLGEVLTVKAGDGPGWTMYAAGVEALKKGDFDGALTRWIETIASGHRNVGNDGPRRACVALFHLLGENHETTRRHRRAFSSALF